MHTQSSIPAALVAALALAPMARAGGTPEYAVLIVDPTNPVSLQIANHYRSARDLPDRNVIYLAPNPGSYAAFNATTRPAFLGALENARIADHSDYVVLPGGSGFYVTAGGIVSDGCAAVNRFAVTTPFTLALAYPSLPVGTSSQLANDYFGANNTAVAFDGQTAWSNGSPSTTGTRYFLATLLGYEGPNGNTVAEILDMIDRSAAIDGAQPAGTFYFCQTTDIARSGPRHGAYPGVVATLIGMGLSAQHLMANLPPAGSLCTGIMTGLADPAIDTTPLTLAPGAFCDHLTSWAGTFDGASQTKMSRWIAKGASATSGTVEEPCNYPGKFPSARVHVYSARGLSLGEAWLRSVGFTPFQVLFIGDPLCRPFAWLPQPSLAGLPGGAASGTLVLVPSATTPHPTAAIARFELLIDGVSMGEVAPGRSFVLDTRALDDGWHELRLLAWDDSLQKNTGRTIVPFFSDNYGRSASLSVAAATGELTTRFDFTVAGAGAALLELRLLQGGRVVAAGGASGTLSVYGRTLGADRSRLQLEVEFTDGKLARSAPLEVDVADTAGTLSALAPLSFSCRRSARDDQAAIVELPASFDDALDSATWTVVTPPAQGTLLGGSGPYRVVQPNVGASGADLLVFRVTTPSGTSADATVTILWSAPDICPTPVSYCVAAPNSGGLGATISWSGSTRLGPNDFTLHATNLPGPTSGTFFYGDTALQVPFGHGFRCVALPLARLGNQSVDMFGYVSRTLDFTQPPFIEGASALLAGGTKRFQFWYRDPAAGGSNFNLTDALAVTFCP